MARDYAPKTLDGIAKQVARDVYKKVGNTMAKDMAHQFVSVIRAFYNDYTPHVYRRKRRSYYYASADGVKAYTKFVKMDADGKGFTVKLEINPLNINSPYTSIVNGRATPKIQGIVFTNTWILGQHGGRLPWSAIPEDKRIGFPGNRWQARHGEYYWQPPVMDRSPMELMDEWFAGYATNENLNKLTDSIVTNSIERYLRRWEERYGK